MSNVDKSSVALRYKPVQPKDDPSNTRTQLARQNSDLLFSYYESSIPNEGPHYTRSPTQDTGTTPANHPTRKLSNSSSSSSDYSNEETTRTYVRDTGSETSPSVTKRLNTPSDGGADRRRMAIVQMDNAEGGGTQKPPPSTASASGSIRQRRGYRNDLAGLALVAPPDAALHTYTHLTPPSTAPITGDFAHQSSMAAGHHHDRGHHRSTSEVIPSQSVRSRRFSVRGITKRLRSPDPQSTSKTSDTNTTPPLSPGGSQFATFIIADHDNIPQGSMDSPEYLSQSTVETYAPLITPKVGEKKEIDIPVAAPIVVSLEQVTQLKSKYTMVSTPNTGSPAASTIGHGNHTTSCLSPSNATMHHVPDGHATSGPSRLSRLQSLVLTRTRGDIGMARDFHQSPLNTTTPRVFKSAKTTDTQTDSKTATNDASSGETNVDESKFVTSKAIHCREGATAAKEPSSMGSSPASSHPPSSWSPLTNSTSATSPVEGLPRKGLNAQAEIPLTLNTQYMTPTTVVEPPTPEPPRADQKLDHTKFDLWLNENPQFTTYETRRGRSLEEPGHYSCGRPLSPLTGHHTGDPPDPPPKSGFKFSLASNLKRLSSLSRTSISSKSVGSAGRSSHETRSPSPLSYPYPQNSGSNFPKTISMNPAALYCHEVDGQNTTMQRCVIYANKINELYLYDCGLSDWVKHMTDRSANPQGPRGPSTRPYSHQPRHTSRSSVHSEATFPRRPDATTATDLTQGQYSDIVPTGLPPQLPYPSLAANRPARSNTSSSGHTPPTTLRSLAPSIASLASSSLSTTAKTGFFATLGRKASISKKERSVLPISFPVSIPNGARLPIGVTKSQTANTLPPPRPIQIVLPPSIPGGPRAPAHRVKRSQTYMSPKSTTTRSRDPALGRRPSLANVHLEPDAEFMKQVDKLMALIPRADRNVLAGYLRRAGSDMLAVGQYLEDERLGNIRLH